MASLSPQIKMWLISEEFDEFLSFAPREWYIEELERWQHQGDAWWTGTKQAVTFEIYAETPEEVDRFWCWFNDYFNGFPDQIAREREFKWKRLAGTYQL